MNYLRHAKRMGYQSIRHWEIRPGLTLWCESFSAWRTRPRWWISTFYRGVCVCGDVRRETARELLAARYGKRAAKRRAAA